jgi:hypothetical protein
MTAAAAAARPQDVDGLVAEVLRVLEVLGQGRAAPPSRRKS